MTASVSSRELCRRAGVSYRQLDHWVRQGLVQPVEAANPGTGNERWFRFLELQRVAHAAKLMRAVNCPPKTAFALLARLEARVLAEPETEHVDRGVTLHFGDVELRVCLARQYYAAVWAASRRAQQHAVRPQSLAATG